MKEEEKSALRGGLLRYRRKIDWGLQSTFIRYTIWARRRPGKKVLGITTIWGAGSKEGNEVKKNYAGV